MATPRKTALGPRPQLVSRIIGAESEQELADQIDFGFNEIFRESLSDTERAHLDNESTVLLPSALIKLDELIIAQAETAGSKLVLSRMVQMRIEAWTYEPTGPALFRKFGEALARSAEIRQRIRPAPLDDPDLPDVRTQTVEELRTLLRSLHKWEVTKHRQPTRSDWIAEFERRVMETDGYLRMNVQNWVDFLRKDTVPTVNHRPKNAPSLWDQWMAFCKGYSNPETVRTTISNLKTISAKKK